MRAVFLDRSTLDDSVSLELVEKQLSAISYYESTPASKVISRSRFADVILTNKVEISAEHIAQLPKLRLILICATGANNVDLAAAKKAGIGVCNVKGYSTSSVSQYVFAMLLEYFQKTSEYLQNVKHGHWQESPIFCHFSNPINQLAGKTIAIIGYGTIGRNVAKIANAFDMKVLIAERKGSSTIREQRVSFEQALSEADIVSLHSPLTPETEQLINADTLRLMKSGSVLVNTARGGLINSEHLLQALKSKKLGAAILDVLEHEPPTADHVLIKSKLNNLMVTAHIAWGSLQAQQALVQILADNLLSFKSNETLNRLV
ncbi:D-2-hydroxyacid dehydrogenase [Thalassotalea crassostreae]|uniref:D-2-hydroxyacid dehydrogenase n=1 Tax=Thalassotalea crassostreae TaxID=1763536 RepID=UPI0008392294|nr:D-2-hydroxyacid dehydrogenase [Thalassotalea crassostreae]